MAVKDLSLANGRETCEMMGWQVAAQRWSPSRKWRWVDEKLHFDDDQRESKTQCAKPKTVAAGLRVAPFATATFSKTHVTLHIRRVGLRVHSAFVVAIAASTASATIVSEVRTLAQTTRDTQLSHDARHQN